MAFMELMTERKFFPPASVWHLMPKLMGPDRPLGWLTVEDLAAIVAKAFGDPERFIGRDLSLASDVQSIEACRAIWREVTAGRPATSHGPLAVRAVCGYRGDDHAAMAPGQRD